MAGQIKPPFSYYGGKTTIAPEIAQLLPAHKHYVEPFAGSLAVLLAKKPSQGETVNDLDGDLVNFWRILRDHPEEFNRLIEMTPHSREEYETSKTLEGVSDIERARRVFVRLTQGRSHSMKPTGWFSRKDPRGHSPAHYVNSYSARLLSVAERLKSVSIENRDAITLIEDYGTEKSVLIYADPPYLGSTRAENYGVEMLTDELHQRFSKACNEAKAAIVVSGYASPLYEALFEGWHRVELKAPTKLSGNRAENEVLWANVPIGGQRLLDLGEFA